MTVSTQGAPAQGLLPRGRPLLELRGIQKTFGPVRALGGGPGGRRRAGHRLVRRQRGRQERDYQDHSGIHPSDGGRSSGGEPVDIHSPKDSAALGIATVYQDLALCDNLDIVQNSSSA